MDTDKLPGYLRHLGRTIENKIAESLAGSDDDKKSADDLSAFRYEGQGFEPDWDDLDRKANLIVARYTAVGTVANIIPFGGDIVAVTAVFTKMTAELAGLYQVMMSNKRARQMSWAIASTTGTVLGAAVAGSKLASFIPGGYFVGVAVQAPLVGAVVWAAGDTLKDYFKQTRKGREPGIDALRESFQHTLRIRLKKAKVAPIETAATVTPVTETSVAASSVTVSTTTSTNGEVGDIIEKIAGMHELLKAGVITQAEFDKKKTELLTKL